MNSPKGLEPSHSVEDLQHRRLTHSDSVEGLRKTKQEVPMYQQERVLEAVPTNVVLSEEVLEARKRGVPIVALETTIFCHGLPYPDNINLAKDICDMIRERGCVPAVCGIINGEPKVGFTDNDLDYLIMKGKEVPKVSRRDIPIVTALRKDGATTVSSTMILCARANVPVFATGGIGGVHRDAGESFDVSADMREFHRSPVCVVTAGAKAVLDLPKTLEVLETEGVPVVGYKTDLFPCFYSRSFKDPTTGDLLKVPFTCENATDVAKICDKLMADQGQGMIVCNPIPEEDEIPYEQMSNAIELALDQCRKAKITGKEVTPYLLKTMGELTGGRTVPANIALAKSNALVACEIAKELVGIRIGRKGKEERKRYSKLSTHVHHV